MRGLLSSSETDSTNTPQMEWIPGTHRLLYTGWTYFVQAEGESYATSAGLYLVDANELTPSVLLPEEGNNLRFILSPDGQHIAVIYTTDLSFINVDGGWKRPQACTLIPLPSQLTANMRLSTAGQPWAKFTVGLLLHCLVTSTPRHFKIGAPVLTKCALVACQVDLCRVRKQAFPPLPECLTEQ